MRVLVVDDSRVMRIMLRKQLAKLGFEVEEAADGQEALDQLLAAETPPDLVTIDWNMPVMDGLELVKNIRADTKLRSSTLMMITTESEYGRIVKALAAGAHEYLMKPFEPEALVDKLDLLGINPHQGSLV